MERGRSALKAFFQTGDRPTQSNYEDLIDSAYNPVDDGSPGLPYDVIALVVSQEGTNPPTIEVLQNTTAATLTTAYTSTGQYTIVSDIDIFFGGKSFMMTSYPGFVEFDGYVGGYRFNNKTFVLRSGTYSGGNSNDIIAGVLVEIRIYP